VSKTCVKASTYCGPNPNLIRSHARDSKFDLAATKGEAKLNFPFGELSGVHFKTEALTEKLVQIFLFFAARYMYVM
jgi:hypothetical protein